MRARDFIDPTSSDCQDVAEWLHTTPDNLSIEIVQEPIEKFITQIKEMYHTYDEFPKDAKRTRKIIQAIKQGGKILPIYVERNDPHKFVMEGRHRMVAFWLLKINIIPVAYVTKIN